MKRKLVMFDLGCGLGGASAAMRDRGWNVYRIDRMRDVRAERYCDLRSILALPQGLDLIWCSTSCQQFSVLGLPWQSAVRKRKAVDLSVELHVKRLIDESRPRFWVVENVISSRKWLTPIFGPVRSRISGHVLWGNVPLMLPPMKSHKTAIWSSFRSGRKRHLRLSEIPYQISEAIAATIERLSDDRGSLCQGSAGL